VLRAGLNVVLGDTSIRVENGLRREGAAVLGAQFGDGEGATTAYAALEGGWSPAANWRLEGRIAAGVTRADSFGYDAFNEAASALLTTQFSAAIYGGDIFAAGDRFWIGVAQPLQVESGALRLALPTAFDKYTEVLTFTDVVAPLGAEGRRLDFEAGYRLIAGPLGAIDINLLHETFGGYDLPAETTALIRSRFAF